MQLQTELIEKVKNFVSKRIHKHLNRFIEEIYLDKEFIIADFIQYKLNKYWLLLDESITVAAIFDPSSKFTTFLSIKKRDTAIKHLHHLIVQYMSQKLVTNTSIFIFKNKKREFFVFLLKQQQINELPLEEIDLYLSSSSTFKTDSLTCVLYKEAFSVVLEILTKVCNHLYPETTCALLCKDYTNVQLSYKKNNLHSYKGKRQLNEAET
ncbi:12485_t:CDS:2, partial [Dentiscutata heterogama]